MALPLTHPAAKVTRNLLPLDPHSVTQDLVNPMKSP